MAWIFNDLPRSTQQALDPDEIRRAFNLQHSGHGGPEWVRLNLSAGPVLARRNIAHHSAPIYVAIIDGNMARHHIVTMKRQLKSAGSATPTQALQRCWVELIGFTRKEYDEARASTQQTQFTLDRIRLYEQGASK